MSKKTRNPNRRDESRPTLVLGKGTSVGNDTIISEGVHTPATATGSTQNVQRSLPESLQATSSVGAEPVPEMEENVMITATVSEYALTPQNFKKLVTQGKEFEARLRFFADQLEPIVDKKIKAAIAPFLNLPERIDKMERRVNETLKEMSAPNLAAFEAAWEKARADITALQSRQMSIF